MKDVPIRIPKGTPIACMVVANIIPETIVVDSPEAEENSMMTIEESQEKLLGELDLSGLDLWTPNNREKAKDLSAEFHDVFTLEEGEMGQTKATQHHIELTDEKPCWASFSVNPCHLACAMHLQHSSILCRVVWES